MSVIDVLFIFSGLPCNCNTQYNPVCASNGHTYWNPCLAKWALFSFLLCYIIHIELSFIVQYRLYTKDYSRIGEYSAYLSTKYTNNTQFIPLPHSWIKCSPRSSGWASEPWLALNLDKSAVKIRNIRSVIRLNRKNAVTVCEISL